MIVIMPDDERGRALYMAAIAAEKKALEAVREVVHLQDSGIAGLRGRLDEIMLWMARSGQGAVNASEALLEYAEALRVLSEYWAPDQSGTLVEDST